MNKISVQDLVSVISRKHGITQKDAMAFVTVLFDVVATGLETDRQVKIKGLGTFKVIDVRDRESVNVNTGERIIIDGRSKITFTPDAIMRDLVNRPFAQFETVVINDGVDIGDFERVDRQTETLYNATSVHTDDADVKEETIQADVEEQVDDVVENSGSQSTETPQDVEYTTFIGEDVVSEEKEKFEGTSEDTVAETPDNIIEEEKNIPEEDTVVTEQVIEPIEDSETSDAEPIEEEYTEEIETTHGSVLKKVLLSVFLLLLISGAAAYMGFYFGKRSVTNDVVPVKVSEKTVGKADAKQVVLLKDTSKSDDARSKHASDTVSERKDKVANIASETVKKPAEEIVAPKEKVKEDKDLFADKYDKANVMVRTGAYRIVGVERTMVLGKGQTLSSVSRAILGPGMECYIEALNGVKEAKEGQTLKIPKLELRRKKKK
ncbi:hypothetical protein HPS54_06045 [Prevotella sp. PCHR]|uniref:HU family DNA-binding protein n=2 Tax=Xylanibacter caecicola TaxID=2736294 RepID=A0ABX2B0P2_9BACT|nr:HU family DNA-binding protein [Xylanibacter caecicola]NPE25081.1 hypothetical protein [Xylanibacter caecicola]